MFKKYRSLYTMPLECKVNCAKQNMHRLSQIAPFTLAFGLIMTIASFIIIENNDHRFLIFILYYSSYFLLSSFALIVIFFLRKNEKTLPAQNILCYFILTAVQFLCLYQKIYGTISEGYIVWTIV